jgi:uncharacterized protein (TIGR02145 family)
MIVCADTATDVEGNNYQAVKIGNQVWTGENLRTRKFNDGSEIPLVTESAEWNMRTTPAYCCYNNMTNADSIRKYGAFYNWYTVDTKKLAPAGWHVPTESEWATLETFLIANGYNYDGTTTDNKIGQAMAARTNWEYYESEGTTGNDLRKNNSSGFSGLPTGYRDNVGRFLYFGFYGPWWSATEHSEAVALHRHLGYVDDHFSGYDEAESSGFCVRLLRDN